MAAIRSPRAQKDGYTILMMSNAHAVSAAMYKTLPYDPVKDFQMLSLVGTAGLVMIAAPEFPANDIKGAIALLKADPDKYNYGSAGVGTTQHFAAELFNQMAGVKTTHIPYRSTPAVVAGLLSKDTHYVLRADPGRDRANPRRHTQGDRGDLAGALSDRCRGADRRRVRPAGLRRDKLVWAVDGGRDAASRSSIELNKAVKEALDRRRPCESRSRTLGAQPKVSTPDELSLHIAGEIAKWQDVREKAGIPQL